MNTNQSNVTTEEVSEITIQSLLESGAHFGSKTSSWNPKSAGFIYGIRNDIYIINLDTTVELWKRTRNFVTSIINNDGSILFVGTKEKVREGLIANATKCNSNYVSHRWLGGTLTNLETIKKSVSKLNKLESLVKAAEEPNGKITLTKKELLNLKKEIAKLNKYFAGLKNMNRLPDAVFVVDPRKDKTAIAEAVRLKIPVISLVDTDIDPTNISYPIPANDDAISTQLLFVRAMSEAILEGRKQAAENKLIEDKTKQGEVKVETKSEVLVEYKNS